MNLVCNKEKNCSSVENSSHMPFWCIWNETNDRIFTDRKQARRSSRISFLFLISKNLLIAIGIAKYTRCIHKKTPSWDAEI